MNTSLDEKFLEAKKRRDEAERNQKHLDAQFENVKRDFINLCTALLYELKFEPTQWEKASPLKKTELQDWVAKLSNEFDLDMIHATLLQMKEHKRKPKLCQRIAEYLEIKP